MIGNCNLGLPTAVGDFERDPKLLGRAGALRRGVLTGDFAGAFLDVDEVVELERVPTF